MDGQLQQKLRQFSAPPPEGAWHKIANALDEESDYAVRLSQYEEQPPAHIWQAVEAGLEKEITPAKVVPFSTRFRRPMRFAAVACFLAVILVTVTLTVKRTEAGAIEAGSETTIPTTEQTTLNLPKTSESKMAPPVVASTEKNKDNNTSIATQPAQERKESVATKTDNNTSPKTNRAAYASLNEYVVFSDGDGKLRKVSKKLADFIQCKENDLPCKQRLQQLRQKMAASIMATDFTSLVESLRQMQ